VHGWLEISPAEIVRNARALALRVAPAALCAVVKSNAYGHGLVPISRVLAEAGIPGLRLGIFSVDEGLGLRESGLDADILLLGPPADDEFAAASEAGLECAVFSGDDVLRYPRGTAVHVKIDTGVARFGIGPADAAKTMESCREAGLRIAGVYSHLANAEDLDETFTLRQLERLASVARPDGVIAHIAASAAAIMWPQTRLDMVRCGIALYGHWPSAPVQEAGAASGLALAPALRWFAPVVQTRDVAAGDSVGYGCDFVPARSTRIAVLPVGYADGLPRAAGGGKLAVAIRGSRAPVVGRICMNACMLDVTDAALDVRRGDVAEFGIDDVASAADTISYEILARLPASLERRYS
jgi:alanine racemase